LLEDGVETYMANQWRNNAGTTQRGKWVGDELMMGETAVHYDGLARR